MTAKSFADSNVVLYTIGKDARKADIARQLIAAQPAISVQVVNECVSVCAARRPAPARSGRRYKTGRNQQINIKATPQVIERLYKIADARRIPLGELLEQALDALERK